MTGRVAEFVLDFDGHTRKVGEREKIRAGGKAQVYPDVRVHPAIRFGTW